MMARRGEFIEAARVLAELGTAKLGPAVASAILRFSADVVEHHARARGQWDPELYAAAERGNAIALAELRVHWAAAALRRRSEAQG